jgi:4-amino-4-deoxy-L-arabinose transferase-like glycosyltransferase
MSYILVIFLFAYAGWLRIYPLETQPLWMDEGYTINAVLSYARGETDGTAAVLHSGGHYDCFVYCAPTAFLANTFGHSMTSYRLIAVIAGMLSLFFVYLVTRKISTKTVAIWATLLTAFSYLHIAWSTQARWYTLTLCFFWAAIWCYLSLEETKFRSANTAQLKKKAGYVVGLFIATTIAIMTHRLALLLPLVLVIHGIYYWWQNSREEQPVTVKPWLIILISASTLLTVDIYTGAFQLWNFVQNISLGYTLPYYLGFLLQEYWLLLPLAIFALTSSRFDSRRWLLAWLFLAYLVSLSFFTQIVHYRYLFLVTPVIFILATLGLSDLLQQLKQHHAWQTWQNRLLVFLFVVLYFASPAGNLLPQERYWLESDNPAVLFPREIYNFTPQPNWNRAYEYIATHRQSEGVVISSHPHFTNIFLHEAGYWIAYDYLGFSNSPIFRTADNREYYAGAQILESITDIENIFRNHHGLIIFDTMAHERIEENILIYINNHSELVYDRADNDYSRIWIYRF